MTRRKPMVILMAEDDPEDRMLTREAMAEAGLTAEFRFVEDGEALLDYLRSARGESGGRGEKRPELILLDLKMPRKDGFEALAEIRAEPHLRCIPVIVLTTSSAEEDVLRSYQLGGNSFITKPTTYGELVAVMRKIGEYWFETVELPTRDD